MAEKFDKFKLRSLNAEKLIEDMAALSRVLCREGPSLIREAGRVFEQNINETQELIALPIDLTLAAKVQTFGKMKALLDRGEWKDQTLLEFEALNLQEESKRLLVNYNARILAGEDSIQEMAVAFAAPFVLDWSFYSVDGGAAIKAIFRSIIIESWLYFEVFAGDLWSAAVDHGPAIFRGNVMDCNEWDKEDKIKVRDVCKLGYDPGKLVGTFYRDIGKASFQKLSSIRKNYEILFNKTDKDFLKGDLHLLSAYRNAIVHRAGKADRHFIAQVQRHPKYRHIKDGDELQLDGEVVD